MAKPNQRLLGIDSIRFLCALWVVFGHIGAPTLIARPEGGIGSALFGLYTTTFNGPAAVIVFFVISGLCIHFPQRDGRPLHLKSFFARRYVRIGLPLVAAVALQTAITGRLRDDTGTLWSLVAEIIYYTLYPVLLRLQARFGWWKLIAAAYVGACCVAATDPGAGGYPSYGDGLNWLLGLPCWLLGCQLAQESDALTRAPGAGRVWLWRGAVVAGGVFASVLRWHLPGGFSIGFPWGLNALALLVFFWLRVEVAHFRTRAPWRWLEAAGAWSYSLYLMHGIGAGIAHGQLQRLAPAAYAGEPARNAVGIAGALAAAYLFYRVVERPSHLLASWLGRRYAPAAAAPRPEIVFSAGADAEGDPAAVTTPPARPAASGRATVGTR